jgi:Fe2+ or Zn2+ uptake regulation protein
LRLFLRYPSLLVVRSDSVGQPPRPGRRHRSRQRERILGLLGSIREHPTASWIHETLQDDLPRLSLGTVYRNLEILVSEGKVEAVSTPHGPTRYDGNLSPHHHFLCEGCGRIEDLELRLPPGLTARVRRKYRVTPRRVRIDFYGLCRSCTDRSSTQPSR